MACLCLALGVLMLPIFVQRLLWLRDSGDAGSAGISLALALGSPARAYGHCEGDAGRCRLIEASALLNVGVLGAVMVALPYVRRSMKAQSSVSWRPPASRAPAAEPALEPQRSVLLHGIPADAREEEVARFLASELNGMSTSNGVLVGSRADNADGSIHLEASSAPAPAAHAPANPRTLPQVLLVPADRRLAPRLERYVACIRDLQEVPGSHAGIHSQPQPVGAAATPHTVEDPESAGSHGDRGSAEFREAETALRRPRREFGDRGWDLHPAPVGLALLRTPKEALYLAEALAPATLAKIMQQCCCPHWAPDPHLYKRMQAVTVMYPAPEPADVIWENMSYADDSRTCRRRCCCLLLVLLYMAAMFVMLSSIRRSLSSGLVTSVLAAVGTLLLQETVRRLIWKIERPCANTHYHATVALVTMAGCLVSGALVPLSVICGTSAAGLSWGEAWYRNEGGVDFMAHAMLTNATLSVLMDALIDTMLPWLFTHVLRRPGGWASRIAPCLPSVTSFRQLCEVHEGPVFYLGPNIGYANFTVVFALCCTAVLPAAPFLVAVGVCLWYAKEKWLLLELCRRPRLISPHVAVRGPDLLAYGLALAPAAAVLPLLPLSPAAYCTATRWLTGQCTSWMKTDQALLRMGLEAAIFANAAVHGWYLGQQLTLRLACCRCRSRCRGRCNCRDCCRAFARIGCTSLRVLLWLLASLFLWLTPYWRGGVGLGEEIDLPFGTISLFTSSVRNTLTFIYDIVVLSLVVLGTLGAVCRLLAGPSTVKAYVDDEEVGLELLGIENRSGLLEAYVKASPFHAVLSPPEGEAAAPSLDGLQTWLQSPAYTAPTMPVPTQR